MWKVSMQNIIDHGYDGNGFWACIGAFCLVAIGYILVSHREKQAKGEHVELRDTAYGMGLFAVFLGVAVFEILTHR
jgi:hypothetical protein